MSSSYLKAQEESSETARLCVSGKGFCPGSSGFVTRSYWISHVPQLNCLSRNSDLGFQRMLMGGQFQCLHVRHFTPLPSRSRKKMQSVANVSFLSMFIMYLLAALFGYLSFYGESITPTIEYLYYLYRYLCNLM